MPDKLKITSLLQAESKHKFCNLIPCDVPLKSRKIIQSSTTLRRGMPLISEPGIPHRRLQKSLSATRSVFHP